jgi:hypothetical protein
MNEIETDEQMERRLSREARTFLGSLGDKASATDTARVEVAWDEADGSYSGHRCAGHYIVHVDCSQDEPGSEEGGPYARAHDLASDHLEQRADQQGWLGWEILDIEAA